ncbi:hypothetical protein UFOVP1290_216 [uncultured Caudovirales phage]|uniref:Uncharacterized protein n=1 Tax=uncultured Caudovirales phage TaxID=2100421 RepID=A0A6J5RQX8_9CAUD|nr:hypothetical protein UFOVP1290_216 [uncultured Caudovirales phage]
MIHDFDKLIVTAIYCFGSSHLAMKFEVAESTIFNWADGTSVPHPSIQEKINSDLEKMYVYYYGASQSKYGRYVDERRKLAQKIKEFQFDVSSAAKAKSSLLEVSLMITDLEWFESEMSSMTDDD